MDAGRAKISIRHIKGRRGRSATIRMGMTKDQLLAKKADAIKQRDDLAAKANVAVGIVMAFEHLLQEMEQEEVASKQQVNGKSD